MNETLLAFDYGERYIGIAVGDTETGIAHPLGDYEARNDPERYAGAEALVKEWRPARLVVGLPLGASGDEHLLTVRSRRFCRKLAARTGLPVDMVDERLSSAAAEETLRSMGRAGRKHKRDAHALAAQIILQAYLDEKKMGRVTEGAMRRELQR